MNGIHDVDAPEKPKDLEQEVTAEEKFIAQYIELTGATETQARNVYMYSDIIQRQNLGGYHLE